MKKTALILMTALCGCFMTLGTSAMAAQDNKPSKNETETVKFSVSMSCENCVKKITENISFEKGVKDLNVSLNDKTVEVAYDPSKTDERTLSEAITKLGYDVDTVKTEKNSKIKETANTVGDKTKETANKVGDKTKETANKVGDKTKETANTVGDKTVETANTVGDKTKETAETVGEKTKETAETVGDKTKETANKVGDKTKETANKVGDFFKKDKSE